MVDSIIKADTTVQPENSVLPLYKSLITSGATNKWFILWNSYWDWIFLGVSMMDIGLGFTSSASRWLASGEWKLMDSSGMVATDPTNGGGSQSQVNGQTYNSIFWLDECTKDTKMIHFPRGILLFNEKGFKSKSLIDYKNGHLWFSLNESLRT